MKRLRLRTEGVARCLIGGLGLVLLVASCANVGGVEGCIEQSDLALQEIIDGTLDEYAPGVAAWEREEARACGFVIEEDFYED